MPDIPALKFIEDQKRKIENLPFVSDLTVDIKEFSTTVEAINKETDELYNKATSYANEIVTNLTTVISAIKKSHARIADGIRERMKWIGKEEKALLKKMEKLIYEKKKFYGDTQLDYGNTNEYDDSLLRYKDYLNRQNLDYTSQERSDVSKIETNVPKNNKNINGNVAEDILSLYKLALQQNQIMQVMSQIEDVINKLDEDIQITDMELDNLKDLTDDWLTNLETVNEREERLKKDKEELKRRRKELLDEIERRNREKEEHKRKQREEEERKIREEEWKKQQEEKRKLEEDMKKKEAEERKRMEEERKRIEEETEQKKREEEKKRKMLEEKERKRKRIQEEKELDRRKRAEKEALERKKRDEKEELERREREEKEEIERKKREEEAEERERLLEERRKKKEKDERIKKEEEEKKRLEDLQKKQKEKEEKEKQRLRVKEREAQVKKKLDEEIEKKKTTLQQKQAENEAEKQKRKEKSEKLIEDKRKREDERKALEEQRKERENLESAKRREAEKSARERHRKEEEVRRKENERLEKEAEEMKRKEEEKQKIEKRKQDEERRKQLKSEEEEKKRKEEEEEKRRKEEEEKRRKEEEEENRQIYHELMKQQDEDRKRRDPNNWPKFIYRVKEKDPFGQTLLCVLLAMPNGVKQSDTICERSTSDLDLCLESNVPDEQFVSSLITVKASKKLNKFEEPIRIYMPVKEHSDNHRISAIKYSVDGEKFKYGKRLPAINVPGVKEKLVGVDIDIRELTSLECVVLASFGHETVNLGDNLNVYNFESSRDNNIQLKIQPKTFDKPTSLNAKVIPRDSLKENKRNNAIKVNGSFVDITFDHKTRKDIDVTVYGSCLSGSRTSQKGKTDHQKIIEGTSDWLVNEMGSDFDESFLEEIGGSDFVEEYKAIKSDGDKNRSILKKLHSSSRAIFNNFVKQLDTKQPEVATKLKNTLSRSASAENMDDIETSSDFEEIDGTLRIVSKVSGKTWEVVKLTDMSNTYPRKRMLKLPAGYDNYQLFGLVVPDNMTEAEICEAAAKIELSFFATNISIICRQKQKNQNEVTIECARTETVSERIQHLHSLGFTEGPQESAPIPVTDGEEITFTFESNLFLEGRRNSSFKVKFFNNLPSENYSGHLMVVDKNDQLEEERYHGYLKYEVLQSRKGFPRKGSMVLYLIKSLEELVGNFKFTPDVSAMAVAKFIAWQLTRDNFNSTRWVHHAGHLTSTSGDYKDICKKVNEMKPTATERERSEMFLFKWISMNANTVSNRVEKLIAAHHNDTDLKKEAYKFVKFYLPEKGIFSDKNLQKMAEAMMNEWEPIATKLGFSLDEINDIKVGYILKIKQSLQMLDDWRLSDGAVHSGLKLRDTFYEVAKSAECQDKLLRLL